VYCPGNLRGEGGTKKRAEAVARVKVETGQITGPEEKGSSGLLKLKKEVPKGQYFLR